MKISRRNFIRLGVYSIPALGLIDTFLIEPEWLYLKKIQLSQEKISKRIIHITDIHYKGDRKYLKRIVDRINGLGADLVCFTGDIVEEKKYLPAALDLLSKIKCPLYGVPGNHDYWSEVSFKEISECFKATGGAWLVDNIQMTKDQQVTILGSARQNTDILKIKAAEGTKRILLTHYPEFVDKLNQATFNLILAGHSHGGQIRLPFWGALIVPYGVGKYDRGLYLTKSGPLYVNPGIGTWYLPIRFNCRPEITIIEI